MFRIIREYADLKFKCLDGEVLVHKVLAIQAFDFYRAAIVHEMSDIDGIELDYSTKVVNYIMDALFYKPEKNLGTIEISDLNDIIGCISRLNLNKSAVDEFVDMVINKCIPTKREPLNMQIFSDYTVAVAKNLKY